MLSFLKNIFKPKSKTPQDIVADRYLAATKHYLDPNPIKRYRYEAMDRRGREIKGTVSGHSECEALQKVKEDGVFPTCIKAFDGQEDPKPEVPRNTYLDIQERLMNDLANEKDINQPTFKRSTPIEEVEKSIKSALPTTLANERDYLLVNVNDHFGTIFSALETLRTSIAVPQVTRKSLTRINGELRAIHERCSKEINKKFQPKPLQSAKDNGKITVTKSTKSKKGK